MLLNGNKPCKVLEILPDVLRMSIHYHPLADIIAQRDYLWFSPGFT